MMQFSDTRTSAALYKKMPRWDGRRRREDEHAVHAQLKVGN